MYVYDVYVCCLVLGIVVCVHRHAQEIEPGYCEPSYWIGLTTLNNGDPASGVAAIKASLSCRYTAAEALTALNKVYVMMMEAGSNNEPSLMTVRDV